MLTTLYGYETEEDKKIIDALENYFNLPLVCFMNINREVNAQQPHWWVRVKGEQEPRLVRKNEIGEILMYKLTEKTCIN